MLTEISTAKVKVNIKRPLFDVGSNECPDFVLNTDMMYFKNINTILLE